jgi:hypothetical protein
LHSTNTIAECSVCAKSFTFTCSFQPDKSSFAQRGKAICPRSHSQ